MTTPAPTGPELQRERTYLLGIAYRMLGSASDAEDIVQEALLRASHASDVRSMRAFLTTVVTRLCLDELGSARRRRETYVGPFLPEPVLTDGLDAPSDTDPERRENVSLALLVVLDQLSPLERAVFVLREVFDLEFAEIAEALGRNEAACRKLLQRAREHVSTAQPSAAAKVESQHAIGYAFFQALSTGDLRGLVELLAEDATLQTDHGGKASAARKLVQGSEHVARFIHGLAQKGVRHPGDYAAIPALLNGAPALILKGASGKVEATFTLRISVVDGQAKVAAISAMRNPDKLVAIDRALASGERLNVAPA
ncbi:MAG: RNA polymerase sigma factor SigJ [Polyangiales bacterium]